MLWNPALSGQILPSQIFRALTSFHCIGSFPAWTYALSYRMHKWPAVAQNIQQLPGKSFLSHFSWATNAEMSSGLKRRRQEANSKPVFSALKTRGSPSPNVGWGHMVPRLKMFPWGTYRNGLRNRFAVHMIYEHNFEMVVSHKVQGPWDNSGTSGINWPLVVPSRMRLEAAMLFTLSNFPDEFSFVETYLYREGKYCRGEGTEFQQGEEILTCRSLELESFLPC